jgi:hypothetical protein
VFMMIWRCSYTTEEDDWMRIGCSWFVRWSPRWMHRTAEVPILQL